MRVALFANLMGCQDGLGSDPRCKKDQIQVCLDWTHFERCGKSTLIEFSDWPCQKTEQCRTWESSKMESGPFWGAFTSFFICCRFLQQFTERAKQACVRQYYAVSAKEILKIVTRKGGRMMIKIINGRLMPQSTSSESDYLWLNTPRYLLCHLYNVNT